MTLREYLESYDNEYLEENIVVDAINKIKDIFKKKTKRLKAIAVGSKEYDEVRGYCDQKERIWQTMFQIIKEQLIQKINDNEMTLAEAQKELFKINREIHEEIEKEWADAEAAWQQRDDDMLEKSKKFYEKLLKVTAKKMKKYFGIKVMNMDELLK